MRREGAPRWTAAILAGVVALGAAARAAATPSFHDPQPQGAREARDTGAPVPGGISPPPPGHWRVNVVPRLSFTDDEGAGAGARGAAFWYRHGAQPYKTAVSFQAFATWNGVQQHFLRIDAIDALGLPLRLVGEVGYAQTLNFHVCLRAGQDLCPRGASPATTDEGPSTPRFYQHRFLQPYAQSALRWRLGEKPHQPELATSWRGSLLVPGELADKDGDGQPDLYPYPGSLYAQAFPDGERGFLSVLQIGGAVDGRDHEPDPVRGYLLQAALRGSHPMWGSAWRFAGVHVGARLFSPLTRTGAVSLASHLFLDVLTGDAPTVELARIGGLFETFAYGGPDVGRGIRQQRFLGAAKAAGQWELRTHVGDMRVAGEHLRFRVVAFFDAGLIGSTLDDMVRPRSPLQVGYGVGLRVAWNRNFVMRIDVALSPAEGHRPLLYTRPDHPF